MGSPALLATVISRFVKLLIDCSLENAGRLASRCEVKLHVVLSGWRGRVSEALITHFYARMKDTVIRKIHCMYTKTKYKSYTRLEIGS